MSVAIACISFSLVALLLVYFWSKTNYITSAYQELASPFDLTDTTVSRSTFWIFYTPIFVVLLSITLFLLGFDSWTKDIWLVSPIFWSLLIIYIFLLLGRYKLLNIPIFFIYATVSSFLSYSVYELGIKNGLSAVLPDNANLRTSFWLVFLYFMVTFLKEVADNLHKKSSGTGKYVLYNHDRLLKKFWHLLSRESKLIRDITLSIMIFENYQRPPIARFAERLFSRIGLANTTGIMQVTSDKALTDEESIKLSIDKFNKLKADSKETEEIISRLIKSHNNGQVYMDEILTIYQIVSSIPVTSTPQKS